MHRSGKGFKKNSKLFEVNRLTIRKNDLQEAWFPNIGQFVWDWLPEQSRSFDTKSIQEPQSLITRSAGNTL